MYLTPEFIIEMINRNKNTKFGSRNIAIILSVSYWGLERKEISQLKLGDVMHSDGRWRTEWDVPVNVSFNKTQRTLYTAEHIFAYLDDYVNWLLNNGLGNSNTEYRGLDPDMVFIVNDRLKPFALTSRKKLSTHGEVYYQTNSLDTKLLRLLSEHGISNTPVSCFRNSWIRTLYENDCAIKHILAVSGLKSESSVRDKLKLPEKVFLTAREVMQKTLLGVMN